VHVRVTKRAHAQIDRAAQWWDENRDFAHEAFDIFVFMKSITLEEVLQLPVPERIRIVEAIWDSIADTPEALELSDEQKAELDRRLESLGKNPDAGSTWTEVRDRIWRGK
jgi:putative addiction module component (TIGR02574 family)